MPVLRRKAPFQSGDRIWIKENYALLIDNDGNHINWNSEVVSRECAAVIYQASCRMNDLGLWEIPTVKSWWKAETKPMVFGGNWKPSVFMGRKLSRIVLEVVSVKPQRLLEISEEDAVAEGVEPVLVGGDERIRYPCYVERMKNLKFNNKYLSAKNSFLSLWEMLNGKDSFELNSFVWRIEFKVLEFKAT